MLHLRSIGTSEEAGKARALLLFTAPHRRSMEHDASAHATSPCAMLRINSTSGITQANAWGRLLTIENSWKIFPKEQLESDTTRRDDYGVVDPRTPYSCGQIGVCWVNRLPVLGQRHSPSRPDWPRPWIVACGCRFSMDNSAVRSFASGRIILPRDPPTHFSNLKRRSVEGGAIAVVLFPRLC